MSPANKKSTPCGCFFMGVWMKNQRIVGSVNAVNDAGRRSEGRGACPKQSSHPSQIVQNAIYLCFFFILQSLKAVRNFLFKKWLNFYCSEPISEKILIFQYQISTICHWLLRHQKIHHHLKMKNRLRYATNR